MPTATVVDDVGGWLTATMDRREAWTGASVCAEVDDLLDAVGAFAAPLALVSPEVGLTVVPPPNRAGGSPTSSASSTSGWPRCATGWCW